MEKYNTIEQVLENTDKSIVFKSKKSLIPGIIILATGIIILSLLNTFVWPEHSAIPALIISAGALLIVLGMINVFYRPPFFVSTANNKKLNKFELNFNNNNQDKIIRMVNECDFESLLKLKTDNNQGLKLRIVCSTDYYFCLVQLIGYVPFEFIAVTEPIQISTEQARKIVNAR